MADNLFIEYVLFDSTVKPMIKRNWRIMPFLEIDTLANMICPRAFQIGIGIGALFAANPLLIGKLLGIIGTHTEIRSILNDGHDTIIDGTSRNNLDLFSWPDQVTMISATMIHGWKNINEGEIKNRVDMGNSWSMLQISQSRGASLGFYHPVECEEMINSTYMDGWPALITSIRDFAFGYATDQSRGAPHIFSPEERTIIAA